MFEVCFRFVHRTLGLNRSERQGSGLNEKIYRKARMPRYVPSRVELQSQITFVPHRNDDRPRVVPERVVNFAFIDSWPRPTVTTEYSVRTAMEAVCTLLDVERAVPEVWGSMYDLRCWLKSIAVSREYGGSSCPDQSYRTDVGSLLRKYGLV
jgi:hypothetical protein